MRRYPVIEPMDDTTASSSDAKEDCDMSTVRVEDSSLEVLKQEDLKLRRLFERIEQLLDPSFQIVGYDHGATEVLRRYEYSTVVKEVLYGLAIRQSAAMDVAKTISASPELEATANRIVERGTVCRPILQELRQMRRLENPMSLSLNPQFEEALRSLVEVSSVTIEWELGEAIPFIAQSFDTGGAVMPFRTAGYVRRHAPRRLCLSGPQWYESAPVISRLLMLLHKISDVQV
jgi:hypothetical protein